MFNSTNNSSKSGANSLFTSLNQTNIAQTNNPFGTTQINTSNAFGSNQTNTSAFGLNPTKTNTAFGATTATTNNVFGTIQTSTPDTLGFGNQQNNLTSNNPINSNLLNSSQQPNPGIMTSQPNTGLFGNTQQSNAATFGNAQQSNAGVFGNAQQTNPLNLKQGSLNLSGNTQPSTSILGTNQIGTNMLGHKPQGGSNTFNITQQQTSSGMNITTQQPGLQIGIGIFGNSQAQNQQVNTGLLGNNQPATSVDQMVINPNHYFQAVDIHGNATMLPKNYNPNQVYFMPKFKDSEPYRPVKNSFQFVRPIEILDPSKASQTDAIPHYLANVSHETPPFRKDAISEIPYGKISLLNQASSSKPKEQQVEKNQVEEKQKQTQKEKYIETAFDNIDNENPFGEIEHYYVTKIISGPKKVLEGNLFFSDNVSDELRQQWNKQLDEIKLDIANTL